MEAIRELLLPDVCPPESDPATRFARPRQILRLASDLPTAVGEDQASTPKKAFLLPASLPPKRVADSSSGQAFFVLGLKGREVPDQFSRVERGYWESDACKRDDPSKWFDREA